MKKIFLVLLLLSLAFCSPSSSRALGLFGSPPPPNCAITPLSPYAPWWIFSQTTDVQSIIDLPAGSFPGATSGCWIDEITPLEDARLVDSLYLYPNPASNETFRIFFLYPPEGGTFELRWSIDNGDTFHRYLRLQATPCAGSKTHWIWIEVPNFTDCSGGFYEVVQIYSDFLFSFPGGQDF